MKNSKTSRKSAEESPEKFERFPFSTPYAKLLHRSRQTRNSWGGELTLLTVVAHKFEEGLAIDGIPEPERARMLEILGDVICGVEPASERARCNCGCKAA